jgi:hypothetical protein
MVTRACLALVVLSGCAAAEGNVLLSRQTRDAAAATPADSGAALERDAQADAASPVNTRGVCRIGGSKDGFYENFSGAALDPQRWLIADGAVTFAGASARAGFMRENVQVIGGSLRLSVRGDLYAGPLRKRSAAAIVTRDLFASGTYQVQGQFVAPAGVEVALWFVRDDDSQGAIDLTTPGRDGNERSYARVHMRTRDASSTNENQFALAESFVSGASHILRFDWYTTSSPSATFWIDDQLQWKTTRSLPPLAAGRLWIVAWLPDSAVADFDTAEIRIDNAFVTPFGNNGDVCVDGALAGPSLTLPL